MTAVCNPHLPIRVTMTDSSTGANAPEVARDVGDGCPVAIVIDPDGRVLGPIQDKEVIRSG
jgi:hypothetical protein